MAVVTLVFVVCLIRLADSVVSAQTTTTGSIEGTVVDVNGAAAPGLTVTATGQGGGSASTTTNEEGFFRISQLKPGKYTVSVDAGSGFARFEQTNIEVNLSRSTNLRVNLQHAAGSENVRNSSGAAVEVTPTDIGGARLWTFNLPPGSLKLYLPDDMRAGDTISGTVSAEPKGKDEKEKRKNASELNGLVVQFVTQRWPVSGGVIQRLAIPATLVRLPEIILLDEKGKKLDSATLPVAPAQNINTAPKFIIPKLGQSGRPFMITGPFDGDSSNTNIKIGGTDAKVIAESPRSAVVDTPKTVVGPNNIVVNDNGNTATGNFRALKIDLTAPKTSLLKGESTELHVEVQGLEGISQPVQVQLQNQTPSNINLSGGNTQNIVIQPSQVTTGGTFNWSGTVTGTGTGGFNITGTIPTTAQTTGATTTPTATPQSTPSSQQTTGQSTTNPNAVPIAGTAKEIKTKCDELQKELDEARRRCEEKRKECAELELKLQAAKDKAAQAQADYDQKKKEYDEALQSLLDSIRKAAAERKPPLDWEFSLAKPEGPDGDNWASVTLEGVVVWFAYPKGKDGKRQKMTAEEAKKNGDVVRGLLALYPELRQKLRTMGSALAEADKKNRAAQAALAEAAAATETCKRELEKLCAEVAELEKQLEECKKQEAEARKREEEANKATQPVKPAGPDTSQPEPTKPAPKPGDPPAPNPQDEVNKKLCEFCIKFLTPEGSSEVPDQIDKLQELAEALGILNDALENSKGPSSLLPMLQKLSAALQAAQAGADVVNQVSDVIKQIKELGAGGNDPANMGKFLKLIGGALQNVKAGGPLVQGLAFFFNQLGALFSAVAELGDALATFRQMRQINGELRKYSCPQILGMFMNALDKANGDMDQALNNFIDSRFGALVGKDERLKDKVKQAILAKLRLCCLQKILKDCPKKK